MTRIWLVLEKLDGVDYMLVDVVFERLDAVRIKSLIEPQKIDLSCVDTVKIEPLDVKLSEDGEVFDNEGRFEEFKVEPFNSRVIEYLKNSKSESGVRFF